MAKILWIEDEASKIDGLVRPLRIEGNTIDIATDKPEALKMLKANTYDLILLDIIIPEGVVRPTEEIDPYEGVKLLQIIRHGDHSNTPVIVLSVVNDSKVKKMVKGLGVKKILSKGALLPSELRIQVHNVLDARDE